MLFPLQRNIFNYLLRNSQFHFSPIADNNERIKTDTHVGLTSTFGASELDAILKRSRLSNY